MISSLSKHILLLTCLLGTVGVSPAFASSTFQNTCSQIAFAHGGNAPTISAVCLRANGTANPTSLTLQGISNKNGVLKQGSGASTFQESCGNIEIGIDGANVSLTAYCRNSGGASGPDQSAVEQYQQQQRRSYAVTSIRIQVVRSSRVLRA
jgi:hypothetical protein